MTAFILALLCGLLGGSAYFAALKASLRLTDGRLMAAAAALRLAAAGALFWLAAQWGAAALLGGLAGFLAARMVMVRVLGGVP